ncbi:MAG TPA: NucA/NucB deoxyribonuclease domain-containing protein, partial [Thermoanaerobaculia bacterium]
ASNGRCFASLPSHLPIAATSNHNNTHSHDDSGSITSDGKYNFGYDATAMMTSLTGADRNERYLYTADDERVAVVRNIGSGRRTTWSISALDNHLLRTWTDDTTTGTRQFTWSEDEIWRGSTLLASDSPTGLKRYHLDHLGSPRLVTNGAGVRIGEQTFDPFGTGGTLDGGRLQFTGHERDVPASGSGLVLDYMHARYYDGAGGRFLSVDPTWESADLTKPQSWNRYSYVLNDPVNMVDPDGKMWWDLLEAVFSGDTPLFEAKYDPSGGTLPKDPAERAKYIEQARARNAASGAVDGEIVIDGKKYPNAARHVDDAQAAGKPSVVTVDRQGASQRRKAATSGTPTVPGADRDEYPPAVAKEGGKGSSVRHIPAADNRGAGGSMGRQLQKFKDGAKVVIKTIWTTIF